MRRLGLFLTSMLVLTGFMALSATSYAEEIEWNTNCEGGPFGQTFQVMNFADPAEPDKWSFTTSNTVQLQPSDYEGAGQICGPWIQVTPKGEDPLYYGGAYTNITSVLITVPYGVQVSPTVDNPDVSDGDYMGNAQVQSIIWPGNYSFNPGKLDLPVTLRADSLRQAPLAEQLPGDRAEMETRKGCPLDADLPNPKTQKVIVCAKVDLPGGLGGNWNWTVRDDGYTPKDPSDDTFFTSIGELFGPLNTYGSVVQINRFYQCERPGGPGTKCGGDGRPNVHFNGYADDGACSYGTYTAVAIDRLGNPTNGALACMPWTEF